MQRAFTLIELLVVIAIIAVLAVVVILVINPPALLQQSRDAQRLSDMSTLNSAINLFVGNLTVPPIGSASTTYISIPDPTATSTAGDQCQGLGLPALPTGDTYQCAASSSYKSPGGTGWLPITFTNFTGSSPLSSLPVDPTNMTSTGLYYSYVTNGTQWEISGFPESAKYKTQLQTNPELSGYPDVLAQGSNLSLSAVIDYNSGLTGWWTLDEGSGTTAYDSSGSGVNGTWQGTAAGSGGTYYTGGNNQAFAGDFNGTNDDVEAGTTSTYVMGTNNFSFGGWVYLTSSPASTAPLLQTGANSGTGNQGFTMRVNGPAVIVLLCDGSSRPSVTGSINLSLNTWYFLFSTVNRSTNTLSLYINGLLNNTASISGLGSIGQVQTLTIGQNGSTYLPGLIDDVRIYNKVLSPAEIQALYFSGT